MLLKTVIYELWKPFLWAIRSHLRTVRKKKRYWTVAEKQLNSVTVFIEICSLPMLLFPKHIILASSLSDLTEDDLKKKKKKSGTAMSA